MSKITYNLHINFVFQLYKTNIKRKHQTQIGCITIVIHKTTMFENMRVENNVKNAY